MNVEFAQELAERLSPENCGLDVAAQFISSEQLLKNYLNRAYGNAYDFDQSDKVEGIF